MGGLGEIFYGVREQSTDRSGLGTYMAIGPALYTKSRPDVLTHPYIRRFLFADFSGVLEVQDRRRFD